MISFNFNGKNSKDFGVYALDLDRTLLPEVIHYSFEIPGKDGTFEFESGNYKNRIIPIQLGILGNYTAEELRKKSREIAFWLSKKGNLIFDDEPDKFYTGRIYNAVNFVKYGSNDYLSDGFNSATCDIEFNVQPFAESVELHKLSKNGKSEAIISVENKGNVKTCGKIIIKNTGTKDITNINISRKVVVD
ncbi:MAG: distal tail protein Dit [Peptoniphilaceae bacterium]